MTKKHYIELAHYWKQIPLSTINKAALKWEMIERFCDIASLDNPNFDRSKFKDACTA